MSNNTTSALRRMPIGIQTFPDIVTENYAYVDKTALVHKLANDVRHNFLSRPRRFGKSLLVSTLKAYFQGKADLFKGLALEELEPSVENGGWTKHEVIHFDFSGENFRNKGLDKLHAIIDDTLHVVEKKYQIEKTTDIAYGVRFSRDITTVAEKTGVPVVILFDEYDKPLLDQLGVKDGGREDLRAELTGFFSVLKRADAYIRFSLLTGITKFAKLTLFSGANQLKDISLSAKYSAICGITQDELESNFPNEIQALGEANGLDYPQTLDKLRDEYDGYDFTGDGIKVYNPFSTINVLADLKFSDYWFESGTPTFLLKEIQRNNFDLLKFEDEILSSAPDIENYRPQAPNIIPLMFQSGYLTIKGIESDTGEYVLGFPNNEVRFGLLSRLMEYQTPASLSSDFSSANFYRDLRKPDFEGFLRRLTAFYAAIPYDLNTGYEKFYQGIFYMLVTLIGQYVKVEEHHAAGSSDVVIEMPNQIIVIEFKLDGSGTPADALAQIEAKGYATKYENDPSETRPVVKLGITFDNERRTVKEYEVDPPLIP
jgi:hypothetical protein